MGENNNNNNLNNDQLNKKFEELTNDEKIDYIAEMIRKTNAEFEKQKNNNDIHSDEQINIIK